MIRIVGAGDETKEGVAAAKVRVAVEEIKEENAFESTALILYKD